MLKPPEHGHSNSVSRENGESDYEAALWPCASATSGAVFSAELGDAETQGNAEVGIYFRTGWLLKQAEVGG